MSLRLYTGEYLASPAPVHMGMNWCTHACFYCFANLNNPQRRADNGDLAKLVKWSRDKKGPLEWWWLERGYPLLVSNDSDPLAKSNRDTFAALHEISREHNIRLMFQTKGGDAEAEAMMIDRPPTTIDITITSDDSALLKDIEPGAPSFEARLELIRKARAAGHHVMISILPLYPAWWQDIDAALGAIHEAGARHIWYDDLHFSRFQIANIPEGRQKRFSAEIKYGLLKAKPDKEGYDAIIRYADAIGFNTYNSYESSKPGFWQPHFDNGAPFMPLTCHLFDELDRLGGGNPVCIDFDWFDAWCDTGAPGGKSVYKEYIASFGRSIRNEGLDQKATSMRQVHDWYWNWLEYPTPLRTRHFHIATAQEGNSKNIITDDEGRPLMVYVPRGTDSVDYDISKSIYIRHIPHIGAPKGGE